MSDIEQWLEKYPEGSKIAQEAMSDPIVAEIAREAVGYVPPRSRARGRQWGFHFPHLQDELQELFNKYGIELDVINWEEDVLRRKTNYTFHAHLTREARERQHWEEPGTRVGKDAVIDVEAVEVDPADEIGPGTRLLGTGENDDI